MLYPNQNCYTWNVDCETTSLYALKTAWCQSGMDKMKIETSGHLSTQVVRFKKTADISRFRKTSMETMPIISNHSQTISKVASQKCERQAKRFVRSLIFVATIFNSINVFGVTCLTLAEESKLLIASNSELSTITRSSYDTKKDQTHDDNESIRIMSNKWHHKEPQQDNNSRVKLSEGN